MYNEFLRILKTTFRELPIYYNNITYESTYMYNQKLL